MKKITDTTYDELFRTTVAKHFPELLTVFGQHGWLWIKAQAWQESGFNPGAESPVGARGLMQLMPGTDMEIDGDLDAFDPVGNVNNGVRYLAEQYRKLSEIPHATDRLKMALAAYNGGRGYINEALSEGRALSLMPVSYSSWRRVGSPAGLWQTWPCVSLLLRGVFVDGRQPDWRQMTGYVEKIEGYLSKLLLEVL
ncbi:transglycosylase SLT domain-containing protein [Desulfuromonas acetoxidans]|uniref:transglycosylase SLT domain-containing protein n=1 Tax=Desulfuromonas acetoxidans TaxID=891 RepID=UPI00292F5F81|nr:transglycosylase SLT domain-containing protein [Desulfuromonas acetoxidans]